MYVLDSPFSHSDSDTNSLFWPQLFVCTFTETHTNTMQPNRTPELALVVFQMVSEDFWWSWFHRFLIVTHLQSKFSFFHLQKRNFTFRAPRAWPSPIGPQNLFWFSSTMSVRPLTCVEITIFSFSLWYNFLLLFSSCFFVHSQKVSPTWPDPIGPHISLPDTCYRFAPPSDGLDSLVFFSSICDSPLTHTHLFISLTKHKLISQLIHSKFQPHPSNNNNNNLIIIINNNTISKTCCLPFLIHTFTHIFCCLFSVDSFYTLILF